MSKRKICVVTGTRAEYGLLFWLMKEIKGDPDLSLQLVVTGAHLMPKFGKTVTFIEADGFSINERIDIKTGNDTSIGVTRSLGLATTGMGKAIDRLKPDILVVLGDRFEILAAASAAMIARIPVAHIHGGEITEGAFDDAMRHAITKMSALHFVAAEEYRARVIQLGESPDRVFNVGAPGLDNIDKLDLLDRSSLYKSLNLPASSDFFLVTYHPATLSEDDPDFEVQEMLSALDQFPNYRLVITGVNADPGSAKITQVLSNYTDSNSERVTLHPSLGQTRYLSAMKFAAAVIGNSSSGIIEAPAMKTPSVNIGHRQKGRLRAPSIIDSIARADDILTAISEALNFDFNNKTEAMIFPYGAGGASSKIKALIKDADLSSLINKPCYDIEPQRVVS